MLLEDGRMWLCLLVSVSRWQEVSPAPGCCQHHASHTVALGRQNWFHVITPDFTNTKSFSIYMLKLSRFSPGLCLGCLFSQILLIIGSGSGSGKVAGVRWLQWPVAVQGSGPRSSSSQQPPADTQGRTFVPGWGPHLTSSPHHILTPHTSTHWTWGPWSRLTPLPQPRPGQLVQAWPLPLLLAAMRAGHGAELWPDPQSPFTFAATAILQLQSDRTFGTQHSGELSLQWWYFGVW